MSAMDVYRARAQEALERYLPQGVSGYAVGQTPELLARAMRYTALLPGKRLRPCLVYACCAAAGGETGRCDPFAAAAEMIHAYSLIHDDLPCMDNDALRRGQPTSHVVFGQAMALLAGDALLSQAAQVMAEAAADGPACRAMAQLLRGAGAQGMVAGQVYDMLWETDPPEERMGALTAIHAGKTAALIAGCCTCGASLAGVQGEALAPFIAYGQALGRAFQIADDILDCEGSAAQIGKAVGKDQAHGKLTYPGLCGLPAAHEEQKRLTAAACAALAPLGDAAADLAVLARSLQTRRS